MALSPERLFERDEVAARLELAGELPGNAVAGQGDQRFIGTPRTRFPEDPKPAFPPCDIRGAVEELPHPFEAERGSSRVRDSFQRLRVEGPAE